MVYDPTKYEHVFLYHWWDGVQYHLVEICKHIAENETNTVIHILTLEESVSAKYALWLHFNPKEVREYQDNLKRNNIRVEIYLGCTSDGYRDRHHHLDVRQYQNHTLHFEPTFFIKKTFEIYTSLNYTNQEGTDLDLYMQKLIKGSASDKIDRLYMCLNGAPREHRINLLNRLKSEDLLNDGYITWHGLKSKWHKQPKRDKHNAWLVNKIIELPSQNFAIDDINHIQFYFPYEARNCVFSLVTETDINFFFVTEKTATPLLIGKPILVYSVQHFHKKLKKLGFALHEDIIDYSFDNYPCQYRRMNGIIDNLKRLKEEYDNNYYELYRKMYPVIAYNSQHIAYLAKKKFTAFNMLQFENPDSKYSIPNLRANKHYGVPDSDCLLEPSYLQKFRGFLPGEIDSKERFINFHGHFPIRLYEPNK